MLAPCRTHNTTKTRAHRHKVAGWVRRCRRDAMPHQGGQQKERDSTVMPGRCRKALRTLTQHRARCHDGPRQDAHANTSTGNNHPTRRPTENNRARSGGHVSHLTNFRIVIAGRVVDRTSGEIFAALIGMAPNTAPRCNGDWLSVASQSRGGRGPVDRTSILPRRPD